MSECPDCRHRHFGLPERGSIHCSSCRSDVCRHCYREFHNLSLAKHCWDVVSVEGFLKVSDNELEAVLEVLQMIKRRIDRVVGELQTREARIGKGGWR